MTATTRTTVTSAAPVGDWRDRAACLDVVDPELFHPLGEDGPVFEAQVVAAKAVCARCPVRAQCLVFALAMLPYGIAGGMTETERHRERVRRRGPRRRCRFPRRPVCGSPAEVARAGRAAIRAGFGPGEVAREFGVSERTALRWAAQIRTTSTSAGMAAGAAEGSPAATGLPTEISQQHNPLAGTRAAEGHRS